MAEAGGDKGGASHLLAEAVAGGAASREELSMGADRGGLVGGGLVGGANKMPDAVHQIRYDR